MKKAIRNIFIVWVIHTLWTKDVNLTISTREKKEGK